MGMGDFALLKRKRSSEPYDDKDPKIAEPLGCKKARETYLGGEAKGLRTVMPLVSALDEALQRSVMEFSVANKSEDFPTNTSLGHQFVIVLTCSHTSHKAMSLKTCFG